jgi:hypothetical protein
MDSATVENLLLVSLIPANGKFAIGVQKNDTKHYPWGKMIHEKN